MTRIDRPQWLHNLQFRRYQRRGIKKGWIVPVTQRELILAGYVGIWNFATVYTEYQPTTWKTRLQAIKWYLWNELFLAGWDDKEMQALENGR